MHRLAAKMVLAFPGMVIESNHAEQGRFASSTRSHYRDKLAFLKIEVDLTKEVKRARFALNSFLKVAQFDHKDDALFSSTMRPSNRWIGPHNARSGDRA